MAPCSLRALVLAAAVLPCPCKAEAEAEVFPVDQSGRVVASGLERDLGAGAGREAMLVDTEGGLHRLEKKVHAHHRHEGAQGHKPAQQAPAGAALLRREAPTPPLVEVPLPLGVRGEQGDQGAQGAQGPKGPVGERGPQGEEGIAGATGPRGFSGRDGANGAPAPKPVPVDCVWEAWTAFSPCDKTCGKHSRQRRDRNVLVFPQGGGKNCDGGAFQLAACDDLVDCPVVLVNASANASANKSMANASSKHKKGAKKAIAPKKSKIVVMRDDEDEPKKNVAPSKHKKMVAAMRDDEDEPKKKIATSKHKKKMVAATHKKKREDEDDDGEDDDGRL